MKLKPTLLAAAATLLVSGSALADDKPVNFTLFNPVQIFDDQTSIKGFRFNVLYGYNRNLTGVDLGIIVNRLDGDLTGGQLGIVNWTETGKVTGGQIGTVNIHTANVVGAQVGAFNYAKEVTGLQWGVVNYAERLNNGLQIGIVNIAKNGFLPVFVIVNFNFG